MVSHTRNIVLYATFSECTNLIRNNKCNEGSEDLDISLYSFEIEIAGLLYVVRIYSMNLGSITSKILNHCCYL